MTNRRRPVHSPWRKQAIGGVAYGVVLALALGAEAFLLNLMIQTSLPTTPIGSLLVLAVLSVIGVPVAASLTFANGGALAADRAGRALGGFARWAGWASVAVGTLVVGVAATVAWDLISGAAKAGDTSVMGLFVEMLLIGVLVLGIATRRRCGPRGAPSQVADPPRAKHQGRPDGAARRCG